MNTLPRIIEPLNHPMTQSPDLTSDRRALARLITQIENGNPETRSLVARLYASAGHAQVIGITGPPGCGKSTLVASLARRLRMQPVSAGALHPQVAIVAVDPTSPFSGGAILGDRVRMRDLSGDTGIFIRSMASRGALGGLAGATSDVVSALDGAGFDVILIETVGAGQLEVDIAQIAQTVIVVEAPGAGDEIQAAKAGILEIADILVVNKADREGVAQTIAALQAALDMSRPESARASARASAHKHGPVAGLRAFDSSQTSIDEPVISGVEWQTPILKTIALNDEGIEAVVAAIQAHAEYLRASGEGARRRARAVEQDVRARLGDVLTRRALAVVDREQYDALMAAAVARAIHPSEAAEQLMNASWGK
ncbi:MAG: methylmalonyl Co-A mutase-associated GTPase MeaB [Candidatus Roseilinea sp.]|uniref:methylmalonyl Co-A mutase-associated GTPase MeaB n=1 Tax=Candidatus Roseilinea sp. TaxID=2838777 RepID=UPI00404AF488